MRSWMISKALVLVCLTALGLPACGGGGGSGVPAPGDPGGTGGTGGTGDARTKEVLETCLPAALDDLMEVMAALQAILGGSGSAVGASIAPGGLDDTELSGRIGWEVDTDGMFPPEISGALLLSDGMGGMLPPISAQQVADLMGGGIDALGAILLGLPDGSRLDVDWNLPPPVITSGQLFGTFTGGVLGSTEGTSFRDDMPCVVALDWQAATLGELQPPFPATTFEVVINADADLVAGSLNAQGTSPATIVVSRNGAADETWLFDPATGLATSP